jgi:hypothetical protein
VVIFYAQSVLRPPTLTDLSWNKQNRRLPRYAGEYFIFYRNKISIKKSLSKDTAYLFLHII